MTDFSSGAVLDDDLDLGAAKGRAKRPANRRAPRPPRGAAGA